TESPRKLPTKFNTIGPPLQTLPPPGQLEGDPIAPFLACRHRRSCAGCLKSGRGHASRRRVADMGRATYDVDAGARAGSTIHGSAASTAAWPFAGLLTEGRSPQRGMPSFGTTPEGIRAMTPEQKRLVENTWKQMAASAD